MRTAALLIFATIQLSAADPRTSSWIRGSVAPNEALRRVGLDVHSVRWDDTVVTVESAGLSLQSFGLLQAGPFDAQQGVRRFTYKIPRAPKVAAAPVPVPPTLVGTFVNGVPIYNPASALSYRNANLWHADIVSFLDDGTWSAQGWKRVGQEPTPTAPLLQSLLARNDSHSPLIGFALDGYPVYGPYGWDSERHIRRFRSSYRLREKLDRTKLPSGLVLTPAQEGPVVGPDFPAGTFVEDYEYVAGLGDLDGSNGRFAITPEFPEGTYAYFLATTESGKLAYPYLIGPAFHGAFSCLDVATYRSYSVSKKLELLSADPPFRPGKPSGFVFRTGYPILEQVHERQMHVVVLSQDLADFEHVHPEPMGGGLYRLDHTFPRPGKYWIYADHTPPGQPQTISRFEVSVEGAAEQPKALHPDLAPTTISGVTVSLGIPGPLETGRDIRLQFRLGSTDLEPYLGSWGHIMIASWDGADFIHAHPIEGEAPLSSPTDFWSHSHGVPGPSPEVIETVTGFNRPGPYKVWLQVQREGAVLTFPWVVEVREETSAGPNRPRSIPGDALEVTVSAAGYTPARIDIPAGKDATLAFRRTDAQNCGGKLVFPELGITKELPVGETVLVPLGRQSAKVLHFGCGMGMYKGSIMVR